MFGAYRTLLAIWVVVDHNFGVGVTSAPAVAGFFCLSGFLMTHLVSVPYHGRVGAFFLNRFLRIYPMYWLTMFGLIWYINTPIVWNWPFIKQVLLINSAGEGLYISPSWAVTNELAFYILIGFGISKTLRRTLFWFAASCIATAATLAYLYWTKATDFLAPLYFPVWTASLPFHSEHCSITCRHDRTTRQNGLWRPGRSSRLVQLYSHPSAITYGAAQIC